MSYVLEGKISNQEVKKISTLEGEQKTICSKCSKILDLPNFEYIKLDNRYFKILHYLNLPYFIYESKSGKSSVYCSNYCKEKHNHRFKK